MNNGLLSRQEKRWLWSWCVAILLLSCVPYVVAWHAAPPGYGFAGVLVNPLDGHSYLAKMRQGWSGSWSFHLTYSPDAHQGAHVYLFYLALGHVARLSGLPLVAVYHLARLAGGLAMLLALYRFIVRVTVDSTERRLAFLLASLSSGLGLLGLLVHLMPVDLWVPEGFAFFSLLTNPHFPFGLAIMLFLLEHLLWPGAGIRCWLIPGLAALLLALVLPFALASVLVVAGLAIVCGYFSRRRAQGQSQSDESSWAFPLGAVAPQVRAVMGALCMCLPVVIYDGVVFATNPALSAWATQNHTPAPALPDLLFGYGLLWPLAIAGVVTGFRQRNRAGIILATWAACTVLMVYFPISLQRRLITGLGLPLGILAASAITRWTAGQARLRLFSLAAIALCSIGNVFLVVVLVIGAVEDAAPDRLSQSRLFLSNDEIAAADWLRQHGADAVVLADDRMSIFLPGMAGVSVVYGHPFETINAQEKRVDAAEFYSEKTDPGRRREIVARYNVDYVLTEEAILSPDEIGLASPWAVAFQRGDVTVLGRR